MSLLSRRRLLGTALAGGVAAVAGRRRAAAAETPAEWAALVAAAKKEGKVAVNTFPGEGYARALKPFSHAYPEIKLEHTSLHSQDFAPRILQERKAGTFTWDLAMIPTSTALQVLRPAGVWDPVRPAIVLPEARDDAGWEGGFERGFSVVKDGALTYGFLALRGGGVTINTDLVKDDQVRAFGDLLDQRWRGKLLLPDVRVMGDTFWPMTSARLALGDDVIKRLFVDQEPVLSRDSRQVAEFMVRGRFPIALGVNPQLLKQFQRQGVGKNLKLLRFPELDTVNYGTTLWLVNRAPHPSAARLFANWLLTKDAQVHWAREVETNSRRLGVEPGNPEFALPRGAKFFQVDAEENLPHVVKTQEIAKAVIK
jgi:iron(III) transport system substrate-binding protein